MVKKRKRMTSMKKTSPIVVFAIIVTLIMLALRFTPIPVAPDTTKTGETPSTPSTLDQVEKSGVIRCGYWVYEPFISKDPNTGELSGLTVDYLEQTAARKGKKIEWVAEVPFDQIKPAIDYGRIDSFCVPCSPNEDFKKAFDFAGSFGKMPYYLYVPQNSTLTREQLQTARFAFVDGYLAGPKTSELFPKAKYVSLPQMTSPADLYNQLRYGKADAILNEHVSAMDYMKANPNVIRRFDDSPVFTVSMSFPVKKGDQRWFDYVQTMTDTARPENKALFLNLLDRYGLGQDTLAPEEK
ncbi:MAG: transporter substrate-binding domain-containing protein [Proteobacteria bacterium]|nr:transporter substrate-binding domain-containing protein [Pseudomonadota bacterium]